MWPTEGRRRVRALGTRVRLGLALLALGTIAVPTPVQAGEYPDKPIRLIVTFVPGGGADIIARYIAQGLTQALGQPVLVENKAGKLRALAGTTRERIAALPQVPTVAESGYKDYEVTLWYGLIGPKGLPAEIVQRINSEVNKILQTRETAAKLEIDGASPAGGSAAQFQAIIRREIGVWRSVVGRLGIKPE